MITLTSFPLTPPAPAAPTLAPGTADSLSGAQVGAAGQLVFNRNTGLWNRASDGGDSLESLLVRAPALEALLTQLQTPASSDKFGVTVNGPYMEDLLSRVAQSVYPVHAGGSATVATSYFNKAVTSSQVVKNTGGVLYGYDLYNPNATIGFLQIFNTTSPNLGTDTPIVSIPVPPTSAVLRSAGVIIANFASAISIGATTTASGSTTVTTGFVVNLYYI